MTEQSLSAYRSLLYNVPTHTRPVSKLADNRKKGETSDDCRKQSLSGYRSLLYNVPHTHDQSVIWQTTERMTEQVMAETESGPCQATDHC